MGIDNAVSPKDVTANYILRYVRGLQNAMEDPVDSLYRMIVKSIGAVLCIEAACMLPSLLVSVI
mgnify:CR=1 FL=1